MVSWIYFPNTNKYIIIITFWSGYFQLEAEKSQFGKPIKLLIQIILYYHTYSLWS